MVKKLMINKIRINNRMIKYKRGKVQQIIQLRA